MRAVVVEALAPDYAGVAVREVPTPAPGPGEVLVRVRAAAVNFPDLLQTRGEYQHKPALPFVAGMEAVKKAMQTLRDRAEFDAALTKEANRLEIAHRERWRQQAASNEPGWNQFVETLIQ